MKTKIFSLALLFFGLSAGISMAQDDALQLFYDAMQKQKNRDYEGSIALFDKAIKADPKPKSKYYFEKGKCYVILKDSKNAITALEKSIEIQPDFLEAHETLGKLYLGEKKYDKAIKSYDNAFKFDKDVKKKTQYKLTIVQVLAKQDKLEEAGNHINDLKQIAPDNLDVLYLSARYYNKTEKYTQARDAMLKATAAAGDSSPKKTAKLYYELGYAYHYLKNYEKKQEAFEKAKYGPFTRKVIELSPQYYYQIALAYYHVFEFEESKRLVERALEMNKDYTGAYDLMVKIAKSQGDKANVIEKQKSSIETERDPNQRAKKYSDLSVLELESKRFDDAIKSAEECLKIANKHYAVTFYKAIAQFKLKRHADAINTLNELLKISALDDKTRAQYSFSLGMIYKARGDKSNALKAYKDAFYGAFKYAASDAMKSLKTEK